MGNLRVKYADLENGVVEAIGEILEKQGVNSAQHSNKKVLRITDEEVMWNLEGGRWLVEINETELIDNNGYTYALDVLNLERLCEVVDSFETV